MSARRIAIADESAAFLAAVSEYVATLPGYSLAGSAPGTRRALELVQATFPDVLLLDLGPAPARGLELVRRIKALPHAPLLIAMTLFHSAEAQAAALAAGADALIGKEAFVSGLHHALSVLFPGEVAA